MAASSSLVSTLFRDGHAPSGDVRIRAHGLTWLCLIFAEDDGGIVASKAKRIGHHMLADGRDAPGWGRSPGHNRDRGSRS